MSNILAHWSVPIGANKVEITVAGDALCADDFDVLAEYLDIFKRQLQRSEQKNTRGSSPDMPGEE
jgi:hypothetical protein